MLTGLVVGKFSPLHAGHEALFDFAAGRCDELVLLSYSKPEMPGCPVERRRAWLAASRPDAIRLVLDDDALAAFARERGESARSLPRNDAPDEEHRAFVGWVCRTMLAAPIDRVFTSEDYGDGFAAALSRALGRLVEHVPFDPDRLAQPVSGTRLRDEPAARRRFLSDAVRRSLVRRVALVGGESTGKTTLAAALAERLGARWVPEYGRELWDARAGALDFADMLAIAREQVAREERAIEAADGLVICDTTPLVTACYSRAMFGRTDPALARLADRSYDLILLCAADFPFVQDGTRRDAAFRAEQNRWYERELTRRAMAFVELRGSPEERLQAALGHVR